MSTPFDLHSNVKVTTALNSQTIATDTTTDGVIIDTAGFHATEFVVTSGTITDGTFVVALEQGDDSGLSDAAAVPADEVLGSASFVAADDNVTKRIGSIGKKRFVRMSIVSTGTSSGGVLVAAVVQAVPNHGPVANQ